MHDALIRHLLNKDSLGRVSREVLVWSYTCDASHNGVQ